MNDPMTHAALMLVQGTPDAAIALVQASPGLNVAVASAI
jgi:hypothetical protein